MDAASKPILCLGEAIVDLVCEDELDSPTDADSFRPHFGGALANVAVAAARAGAPAALAGGVGDDGWGAWLRARLDAEGVDLRWFSLVPELQTPLAFVTFDRGREPTFAVYGDGIDAGMHSVADRVADAVDSAGALVFGSNTLVGEPERELTMEARRLALERGAPVLFDPNIRPNRWAAGGLDRAAELCRAAMPDAFVVRANAGEARLIAGLDESVPPAEAATALCALGATVAVVTMGADGALARGAAEADLPAPSVEVVSPLGAGDAFLGALAAGIARRGWSANAVAESVPEAVDAGSRACLGWGALS
jgi:sugar/nucleoside kinase (ribokinase family)